MVVIINLLLFLFNTQLSDDITTYGFMGHLRGLAVACWTTDHYLLCSNLDVDISESCLIFYFASLPLEVARPI